MLLLSSSDFFFSKLIHQFIHSIFGWDFPLYQLCPLIWEINNKKKRGQHLILSYFINISGQEKYVWFRLPDIP